MRFPRGVSILGHFFMVFWPNFEGSDLEFDRARSIETHVGRFRKSTRKVSQKGLISEVFWRLKSQLYCFLGVLKNHDCLIDF